MKLDLLYTHRDIRRIVYNIRFVVPFSSICQIPYISAADVSNVGHRLSSIYRRLFPALLIIRTLVREARR